MPKTVGTRKQKAAELLKLLHQGPAFSKPFDGSEFTPEEAARSYKVWAETWVIPELKKLVPELREKN